MRIAMIGQRGVPATFGGIERHVEELGARIAHRGHQVTVFCRSNYVDERPSHYRGMDLEYLPTVGTKHMDAICHSLLSTGSAMRQPFDILHYHAFGPGLVTPVPRLLSRAKVVQTAHGRDDERAKWGIGARSVLGAARWMSARVPDATIAVSKDLAAFYEARYGRSADYIPNGVVVPTRRTQSALTEDLGVHAGRYVLFVGRLVPEKNPDMLIRAFRHIEGDIRLVIVGGSSYTTTYVTELTELAAADPRVILAGYQYGQALDELYTNPAVFVLPSALEGLPITLLEAGAYGAPIVASDIAPNLEILGNQDRPGRRIFRSGSESALVDALRRALRDTGAERMAANQFRDEIVSGYDWDRTTDRTEDVYRRVLGIGTGGSAELSVAAERRTR